MAVIVNDSKGYTQDEFKEYLKTTISSISADTGKNVVDSQKAADSANKSALSASSSASSASKSETDAKVAANSATAAASTATAQASDASKSATTAIDSAANAANSATAAANSATAAANSATAAANSAKEQQADWNVTDTTSKAFIKNKPTKWNVLDLTKPLCLNGEIDYTTRPLIDVVRANRLAFLPAEQIIIEQTIDGGQTWTDAGFQDAKKENLFNETRDYALGIPKINGKHDPPIN